MKRVWPMQEAKSKLNEVLERAIDEGPQTITRRGREVAVVVSMKDFRALTRPEDSLVRFFRDSPLAEGNLDFERVADCGRRVELCEEERIPRKRLRARSG